MTDRNKEYRTLDVVIYPAYMYYMLRVQINEQNTNIEFRMCFSKLFGISSELLMLGILSVGGSGTSGKQKKTNNRQCTFYDNFKGRRTSHCEKVSQMISSLGSSRGRCPFKL